MLLYDVYDYEGRIIEAGIEKETAALILGVSPKDLYKKTVVKGRKKRMTVRNMSYIVYKEGQTVTESASPDNYSKKMLNEFDEIRKKILSCTGATERR